MSYCNLLHRRRRRSDDDDGNSRLRRVAGNYMAVQRVRDFFDPLGLSPRAQTRTIIPCTRVHSDEIIAIVDVEIARARARPSVRTLHCVRVRFQQSPSPLGASVILFENVGSARVSTELRGVRDDYAPYCYCHRRSATRSRFSRFHHILYNMFIYIYYKYIRTLKQGVPGTV